MEPLVYTPALAPLTGSLRPEPASGWRAWRHVILRNRSSQRSPHRDPSHPPCGCCPYEADQSDPLLCLVTLVPTDPDVAVLVENRVVALLLHHFILDGFHDVEGHTISWEKSAQCTSSLPCRSPSRACALGAFRDPYHHCSSPYGSHFGRPPCTLPTGYHSKTRLFCPFA